MPPCLNRLLVLITPNFLLKLDGEATRLGFYTTRFVRAETTEEAELVAVDRIRKDKNLSAVLNRKPDPPMLFADEIARVYASSARKQGAGFTFFPMRTARGAGRRPTRR
jgi:hypothetical protein